METSPRSRRSNDRFVKHASEAVALFEKRQKSRITMSRRPSKKSLQNGTPSWEWSFGPAGRSFRMALVFQEPNSQAFIRAETHRGTRLFSRPRPYSLWDTTPAELCNLLERVQREATGGADRLFQQPIDRRLSA